jgi:hypothetical protein
MEINEYEIDGLIQTLRESGIKGIMKYSDVLVLNHMCERGWIPSNRDGIIKTLKENTDMDFKDITNLLQRYNEWKRYLPSYSLGLNQKLDSVNKSYNSIVPFRWIGEGGDKKLIGFVKDENGTSVFDGSGNHLIKICGIDENFSINWGEYVQLTSPQRRYIVDEVKKLKGKIW